MSNTKTATLTFRVDPGLKNGLRMAADQEHRSLSNMVEFLIRDYCERKGIPVSPSEEVKNNNGVQS
ncbi:type II toxin-antitoxin system antitoxin [Castellaniella sp. WN]